mgnify:CR=1 FL=1|tara:strand:- start:15 stop:1154 length:1140 start_codon:yes stop_codon:yes gene_type:complete
MDLTPKTKLDRIAEIWNCYIWKYKYCNRQIKFNDDLRTNYFGDILNYFSDTFSVLEKKHESNSFQENFENSISFLQAIYIQQDFIEELHFIFKTGIVKGNLKEDPNYSLNREIRNESIGHPVRKIALSNNSSKIEKCPTCGITKETTKNKQVLLSSVLFSNKGDSENIRYLKYHRDNNFQSVHALYSKEEILKRHYDFLNHNLDKIINSLKKILRKFLKKLKEIDNVKDRISFEKLLSFVSETFEYIFMADYLFQPQTLIELSKRQNENLRYENALKFFFKDLNIYLQESIEDIEEFLDDKDRFSNPNYFQEKLDLNSEEPNPKPQIHKESYTYELGKLVDKKRGEKYNFFISILESRCEDNEEAICEINVSIRRTHID